MSLKISWNSFKRLLTDSAGFGLFRPWKIKISDDYDYQKYWLFPWSSDIIWFALDLIKFFSTMFDLLTQLDIKNKTETILCFSMNIETRWTINLIKICLSFVKDHQNPSKNWLFEKKSRLKLFLALTNCQWIIIEVIRLHIAVDWN